MEYVGMRCMCWGWRRFKGQTKSCVTLIVSARMMSPLQHDEPCYRPR